MARCQIWLREEAHRDGKGVGVHEEPGERGKGGALRLGADVAADDALGRSRRDRALQLRHEPPLAAPAGAPA